MNSLFYQVVNWILGRLMVMCNIAAQRREKANVEGRKKVNSRGIWHN